MLTFSCSLAFIVECHWEDGRTYKGEWRAGMAHGQGVETYPDGRIRHEGHWFEDEPIDAGP
jgi:MORN repeat